MSLSVTPIRNHNISFRADGEEKPDVKKDDTPRKEPVIDTKETPDSFKKGIEHEQKPLSRREKKRLRNQEQGADVLDKTVDKALTPDKESKPKKIRSNIKRAIGNSVDTWERFLKFKARTSAYVSGIFNGVVAGLGVGGSVMAIDWAMNGIARISRKEATSSMYIKEPAVLVTGAFKKVFKGVYALPDKTIRQITKDFIHSPVTLYNYVKNAPNVTKIGKVAAPLAGGAVLVYHLGKSILRANGRVANIEHAFSSGHAHDLK